MSTTLSSQILENILVEKGELKTFLAAQYGSNRTGLPCTASASRPLAGTPGEATTNLYLQPGQRSPEALIAGVDEGVFLEGTIGFGFNPVTGEFSRGGWGRMIRGGELAEPIGEFTVSASFEDILNEYINSDDYGNSYTFTQEDPNQFKLITIQNVIKDEINIGYLAITENANEIRTATNERKAFVIRTAIAVGFVILIFSFVLSRYFIKPIQNLVSYTRVIKEKSQVKTNIESLKSRKDELGLLSNSLDDMTTELQKRVAHAENFSTDLVHEIRNPLASLKSASEILQDADNSEQRIKLLNILSHDVLRIERLITDYSQMLKDEVALSKEKMKNINIEPIIQSVVDDYNNIQKVKKDIKINYENDGKDKYIIKGIENRIEQIIANLLDNSISFSQEGGNIFVNVSSTLDKKIEIKVIDEGQGFKEKDTTRIFNRFYSNRPEKFGEHSGLGLNIVKNLVDLHEGEILASNRLDKDGAVVEIRIPSV